LVADYPRGFRKSFERAQLSKTTIFCEVTLMAYGVSSPKSAVQYTADDSTVFLYRHTADVATAGGFGTGFGEPHPAKGSMHPRHVGLHSGAKHTTVPIATQSNFNAIILGEAFSYAGLSWQVTSRVGEKTVLR
jgi:hypothetical protein